MTIEIKRMWEGGPLRQFSEKRETPCTRFYQSPALTGYTGAYVCDDCQRPCLGVYRVKPNDKWVCAACKEMVKTLISSPGQ